MGEISTRREALNLRIKPEDRGLIDRAAESVGKTRTDFVLDAARTAAQETLLNQTIFHASPEAFKEFQARLDAPPRSNARLLRTMRAPAPWKKA